LGLRLLLGFMSPMRPALKTWKTPNPNTFTALPPIQTPRWNVLAPTKNSPPNCKLTHLRNLNASPKNPQSQSSTTCGHSSVRPNNKKTPMLAVKEKTRKTRTYQLRRDGQNRLWVTLSAWKRRCVKIYNRFWIWWRKRNRPRIGSFLKCTGLTGSREGEKNPGILRRRMMWLAFLMWI
jgi:hypothetical protein